MGDRPEPRNHRTLTFHGKVRPHTFRSSGIATYDRATDPEVECRRMSLSGGDTTQGTPFNDGIQNPRKNIR